MNPAKPSIPTKEEFEAASQSMAARIRTEQALKALLIPICVDSPIFRDVFVALPTGRCHVDLFVNTEAEKASSEAKDLRRLILDFLTEHLPYTSEINVDLYSHQNVIKKYNGSYFYRFR